jgi:hypothetical protein
VSAFPGVVSSNADADAAWPGSDAVVMSSRQPCATGCPDPFG